MGIRETLNQRPKLALGASAAVVVLAVGVIAYQLAGASSADGARTRKVFVSTDDGKTFLVHASKDIPPFALDGKEAVLARVYECDGKRFVAYLQKFSPGAKKELERLQGERGATAVNAAAPTGIGEGDYLYKKPGDADWYPPTNPKAAAALRVRCPGGGGGVPMAVDPQ
jgi:hypothetical protein